MNFDEYIKDIPTAKQARENAISCDNVQFLLNIIKTGIIDASSKGQLKTTVIIENNNGNDEFMSVITYVLIKNRYKYHYNLEDITKDGKKIKAICLDISWDDR